MSSNLAKLCLVDGFKHLLEQTTRQFSSARARRNLLGSPQFAQIGCYNYLSSNQQVIMEQSTTPDKWLKWTVAIATLVLITGLYVGLRWRADHISLAQVVDQAVPYEMAVSNLRPTVIEFYADWCESCQSMAKDNYALEQQYGERINFVMLYVDNN